MQNYKIVIHEQIVLYIQLFLGCECEDLVNLEVCQKWLEMGKCSKEWAILKCPKTCGGGECCVDTVKAKKCIKWKNKGKCSKKWVAKNCPKTCHLCENSKQQRYGELENRNISNIVNFQVQQQQHYYPQHQKVLFKYR